MTTINKYRVWCSTEEKYLTILLEDGQPEPTTCPNNTTHTIDSEMTAICDTYEQSLPVDAGSGGIKTDMMQHPHGWTYLRLGFFIQIPIGTPVHQSYVRIEDEAGLPMQYRALTGGYFSQFTENNDNFDVHLVVKGSAVGGVDGVNDIVLDTFIRNEYPIDNDRIRFLPPDRSMLLPATANLLNPALPAASLYFRITYRTASETGLTSEAEIHFNLEGFEPPAS